MAPRSTYPFLDRLLDGNLAEVLRARRAAGDSFEAIARDLSNEHGIEISLSTVRRWIIDLEGN